MSTNNDSLPDKLYYDVICTNLLQTQSQPPILSFIETRSNPFVYQPDKYYCSIIRFTVDTPLLPVFIPEIQPNQSDVNLTVYSVTLEYISNLGNKYTQQNFIQYSPQYLSAEVPQPPSQTTNGLQNNTGGYYYIYNYQYWIYLINQTFQQCYDDLANQVTAAGNKEVLPSQYAPVLAFDTGSSLGFIYADVNGYSTKTDATTVNQIGIYMNSNMYQLFSSFPVYILDLAANNQGKNVQIQTNTFSGTNLQPYPPSGPKLFDAIVVYQEVSTIDLWNPVTSLVFCSNTLPIVPNQISAPLVFVNGLSYNIGGNSSNQANIVTDLVAAPTYKPTVIYTPSAQYRLLEMRGNRPLYTLDITCYWKNRLGELTPLRLSAGSTATLKFLFSLKSGDGNYK